MIFRFALISLSVFSNIYSQKTISKTEYYENSKQIYSRYHVFESYTSIRQGEIKVFKKIAESDYKFFQANKNQERLLMAKGQYDGNIQVGIWEIYSDKTYLYDVDKKKLLNYNMTVHYPILAQELGKQGMVVIQYDIDKTFRYANFKGLVGDSLLIKGAIEDYKSFNNKHSDLLNKMSIVIEDFYQENVKDTINYNLE